MSLVSFASAKGSPGVSQLVAGLGRAWGSTTLVADLDPIGGDTAVTERDADGQPLDLDRGLLSLGVALRGGKQADLAEHLQTTESGHQLLLGVSDPGQIVGLGPVWPHIAGSLQDHNGDVLADCGRFVPGAPTQAVIARSNALVLVTRPDVPSVAHLRARVLALREPLGLGQVDAVPVGIVVVGDLKGTRDLPDIVRLIASAGAEVRGLGTVAHDPRTVSAMANLSDRAVRRSIFQRSVVEVAENLRTLIGDHDRFVESVREGA